MSPYSLNAETCSFGIDRINSKSPSVLAGIMKQNLSSYKLIVVNLTGFPPPKSDCPYQSKSLFQFVNIITRGSKAAVM